MIGSLKGIITYYCDRYLILEIGGVGYKVIISKEVFGQIKSPGQQMKLFTFTYVREDILDLYGFSTLEDLNLFEMLITVSGVGPKTAMGIFSAGKRTEIIDAIVTANVNFFLDVPRLGRKNAQKIIIELKNKVGSKTELDLSESDQKENKEISEALKSFGFSLKEAHEAIKAIKDEGNNTTDKIKLALKYLGK